MLCSVLLCMAMLPSSKSYTEEGGHDSVQYTLRSLFFFSIFRDRSQKSNSNVTDNNHVFLTACPFGNPPRPAIDTQVC